MLPHNVTCESVLADTATFSGLDLTKAQGSCSCFLFHLHDAQSCAHGAMLYISQFGNFDPQLFLQLITLVVAFAAWRRPHGEDGLLTGHLRDDAQAVAKKWWYVSGRAKVLVALVCSTAIGWGSRLSYLVLPADASREWNMFITALYTCATVAAVVLLQAEWFEQHSAEAFATANNGNGNENDDSTPQGRLAAVLSLPLTRSLSAWDAPWWRDLAENPTHRRLVTGCVHALGVLCLAYPIAGAHLSYRANIKVGIVLKQPSALVLQASQASYMFAWAVSAAVCLDFCLCVVIARHRGLAGGDPVKLGPERQRDQTALLGLATGCLAVSCCVNVAILNGSLCPYVEAHVDPRGDPHEQVTAL
jgi:hypothetical protein